MTKKENEKVYSILPIDIYNAIYKLLLKLPAEHSRLLLNAIDSKVFCCDKDLKKVT